MNSVANLAELVFEIVGNWIALDEGSAQNNQARSKFRSADRLLHRKTSHRLDRHLHRCHDLSQLIERAGIWFSHRRETAAFIVADMVDDVIASQILQPFCGCDPVIGSEIVTHHFQTEILRGLHHRFNRLRMSTLHNHDMRSPRLCGHLGISPAAIHGFQVCHDGNAGKLCAQSTNTVHSFGNDEGSARLQPVDSGTDGDSCGFESFGDRGEVQRYLYDGFHYDRGGSSVSSAECTGTSITSRSVRVSPPSLGSRWVRSGCL